MRYLLLNETDKLHFVAMPESYMYQLVALLKRLHKEVDKLTIADRPALPVVIAEMSQLELVNQDYRIEDGLAYVSGLEKRFATLKEENYPLISLLTEIRALQAQLEFLQEEE
ncbi:MAG: hydrolase/acyltransferase [Clostridia bacterium]